MHLPPNEDNEIIVGSDIKLEVNSTVHGYIEAYRQISEEIKAHVVRVSNYDEWVKYCVFIGNKPSPNKWRYYFALRMD